MSGGSPLHELGPLATIPLGEGRVFRVGGEEVAVFRARNGQVFATQASCPHRSGPLADGLLGDDCVVCPLHGYAFDLQTGEARSGECRRLSTYQVHVEGGRLSIEAP
jgi:nitrite reductase [NAD(P)H] small subunit